MTNQPSAVPAQHDRQHGRWHADLASGSPAAGRACGDDRHGDGRLGHKQLLPLQPRGRHDHAVDLSEYLNRGGPHQVSDRGQAERQREGITVAKAADAWLRTRLPKNAARMAMSTPICAASPRTAPRSNRVATRHAQELVSQGLQLAILPPQGRYDRAFQAAAVRRNPRPLDIRSIVAQMTHKVVSNPAPYSSKIAFECALISLIWSTSIRTLASNSTSTPDYRFSDLNGDQ